MTVGEKIQYHRKKAGLSQEDLGRELLVSRQTVSLWETGQTLPTIDNLIRLKDIFGISIDEMLCEEASAQTEEEIRPLESHTQQYTEEDFLLLYKINFENNRKTSAMLIFFIVMLALETLTEQHFDPLSLFIAGFLICTTLMLWSALRSLKKSWNENKVHLLSTQYRYDFYEDHLVIHTFTDGVPTYMHEQPYTELNAPSPTPIRSSAKASRIISSKIT